MYLFRLGVIIIECYVLGFRFLVVFDDDDNDNNGVTFADRTNNWLIATGTAKPNFDNLTDTKSDSTSQIWQLRTNATSAPWQYAWSANLSASNPNSTIPAAEAADASYAAVGVKHLSLQVPQSLLMLYDAVAGSLHVLTFWWFSPRVSPDPSHPPRAVPVAIDDPAAVVAISALDSSFGVFVASPKQIVWVQVAAAYSASSPSGTSTNESASNWPHAALWPTTSSSSSSSASSSSSSMSSSAATSASSSASASASSASSAASASASATSASANSTASSTTSAASSASATATATSAAGAGYAGNTTVINLWLSTDVSYLYVLSRTDTATDPFYNVHRYPALGPDTPLASNTSDSSSSSSSSSTSTSAASSSSTAASATASATATATAAPTSSLPGTPLLTLNASTYPVLPADVTPSCLAAHPRTSQLFVGLASANDSLYGVLVYAPATDPTAAGTEPYVLTQWVRTSFLNVRALDVDNDGTVLFVAGDDGADEGRLDSLDVSGSDSAAAPTAARNLALTAFAAATAALLVLL
ncbi:hypothetical protein HK405_000554 [Cladochytrium tenue]|nr:hypothetical protein HK405_000554 [Cladochytrium tenue]